MAEFAVVREDSWCVVVAERSDVPPHFSVYPVVGWYCRVDGDRGMVVDPIFLSGADLADVQDSVDVWPDTLNGVKIVAYVPRSYAEKMGLMPRGPGYDRLEEIASKAIDLENELAKSTGRRGGGAPGAGR